uniref:Sacsin n=1 Tax=Aegilops tauschii TaxID=37682 RepID=M8AR48_AEGTA
MAAARAHMERLRRERYYIGRGEQNPLVEDMHQAVNYLSQELYSKDVHFLMELVQSNFLHFSKHCLVISDCWFLCSQQFPSICGVGKSTKKGNRDKGYIGEKGIGFKSVFLISSQPHIFSNGYQIKFNEKPCPECNIGYIVPEWVESRPSLSDIKQIYGSTRDLPTTCIVLPLKDEKVTTVKQQLSSLHPEMLLFLSKIRRLSVREDNGNAKGSTVSEIAISSEKNFEVRKNMHAESYTVFLSAQENESEAECGYHMWRQRFPVKALLFLSKIRRLSVREDNGNAKGSTVSEIAISSEKNFEVRKNMHAESYTARESGVDLKNLSTHGTYILSSHFDKSAYNSVLTFLDVKSVSHEWYAKCIEGSNLVSNVDEQLYLELLSFVADSWQNLSSTKMMQIPLLKYVDRNKNVSVWSISRASQWSDRLCIASDGKWMSWLISWNQEFPSSNRLFVSPRTQTALQGFAQKEKVTYWLQSHAKVEVVSVYNFGNIVVKSFNYDRRPAIAFSHFLYHSSNKNYMESYQLADLCHIMPVIDNYGNAVTERQSILVPANGSKWVGLMGINPWRNEKYIKLSADYKSAGHFAGNYTPKDQILDFLKTKVQASDVPFIHPPNASFPTASSHLTVDNAILLLQWIRNLKSKDWAAASCISTQPFLDVGFYGESILHYKQELKLLGVQVGFENSEKIYKLVIDNFKFSSSSITSDATAPILKCIRYASPCDDFLRKLRDLKWLKTNVGFRAPGESFFLDQEWECLLKVFDVVPIVDSWFYGSNISPYKEEMKKTGLIKRFDQASKAVANIFKQMVLKSSLTKASVLALLACYWKLRTRDPIPVDLFNCMRSEKWLCTSLGFRSPSEAILFDEGWQSLSPIASLPFINDGDSNGGLGKEIHGYKAELKDLGVTTEVKAHVARPTVTGLNICDNPVDISAARFVISGLNIPADPAAISAATVLSLLGSVKSWLACTATFPKEFMKEITSCKWLKTTLGYQSPDGSILFDPKQSSICITDGPFIDESFCGSEIASFKDALAAIGVTVDVQCGHGLVAQHLRSHKETATISRIYLYLKECSWGPEKNKEGSDWIWIPNEKGGGEWVSPVSCVLHDQNNLLSQQMHVLGRYYDDRKLLDFFSSILRVRHGPNAEDHCKLWSAWESYGGEISVTNCSALWQFTARNWSKNTEKLLSGCMKVPVCTDGKIILSQKEDVFIPDDLLLKDLFDKLPRQSIFIWYPPSISRARLNNDGSCKTVAGQREVINAGLVQIVLAFLADPALDIASKERHTMVPRLLNVSILETTKPITMGYRVTLSSGEAVDVEASQMIRWERESSKLYVQQSNGAGAAAGYKEKIKFATNFADEVARGLLFETPDRIPWLAELVKVGSLVDFQDDVVKYLLKSKNLQLFPEDEAFLNAASLGLSLPDKLREFISL